MRPLLVISICFTALIAVAAIMYISIMYKIVNYGP